MTPFNLEQALAGKPFTNDKGWTLDDWHYFKGASIAPIAVNWKENSYVYNYKESELFMLPEKKKVWIVVYRDGDEICANIYQCPMDLQRFIDLVGENQIETIEKEYEL